MYTVDNLEPTGSPNYITAFGITVNAPIDILSSPTGWAFSTDNSGYVYWYNTDASLPYPNDIAPGASLSGFNIESSVTTAGSLDYSVYAWDHTVDGPGPASFGDILAPSAPAAAPEASTGLCFTVSIVLLGFMLFPSVNRRRIDATNEGSQSKSSKQ